MIAKKIWLPLFIALTVIACSDDPAEKATDIEKHQFQKEFADDCVARELKNSVNTNSDKPRIEKSCTCIAKYMMKDLTGIEAEKVLEEDTDTQSLRIRFDNAAYNCLQEDTVKNPKIMGRP
ncbi:MAG: hypothetical protein KAG10_11225 [Methylococcales bacterium]|nr:hypothetical protein [Methylococcales bacterium]